MASTNSERKRRILKQIDALKSFPNTRTVRRLRKELKAELQSIAKATAKQAKLPVKISKRQVHREANISRSGKLRKYHNYIRQIRNSYPDVSYTDLRKMFKLRKEGKEVEVPDVVWQNPSP